MQLTWMTDAQILAKLPSLRILGIWHLWVCHGSDSFARFGFLNMDRCVEIIQEYNEMMERGGPGKKRDFSFTGLTADIGGLLTGFQM